MTVIGATTDRIHEWEPPDHPPRTLPIRRRFAKENRETTGKIVEWLTDDHAKGASTFLSWKPAATWSPVLPPDLHRLLDWMADLPFEVLFAVHHEPENDISQYGPSSAWQAMQQRVRQVVPPNVSVGPVLMSWTFAEDSGRHPEDWMHPDDRWLGVDHYPSLVSDTYAMPRAAVAAEAQGIPLLLPEVGCTWDEDQADVFLSLVDTYEPAVACYFDVDTADPGHQWALRGGDLDQLAEAAANGPRWPLP